MKITYQKYVIIPLYGMEESKRTRFEYEKKKLKIKANA
jgi:hypothetical protein